MDPNDNSRDERDLSSVQSWLESGNLGGKGGKGVAGSKKWAAIDMGKIVYAADESSGSEGEDSSSWISSEDRNPVHRDRLERLRLALEGLDRDTEVLELVDECPKDEEWGMLGQHFHSVKWLLIETGFNEHWFDRGFPLRWPLELLVISSACGELVTSPAILDGRVTHLVLYLTCNLRFEGPDSKELDSVKEFANQTERELNGKNLGMTFTYRPSRAAKWLMNNYEADFQWPNPVEEGQPESQLKTLEILENDAIDTFQRFALSHSHVVMGLEKLNLRSTQGNDFSLTPEGIFPQLFTAMGNLRELELSLGSAFHDDTTLPNLYKSLPPNLERLSFRGPPSLAGSEQFNEWIAAFSDPDFQPSLKRLSFVLDLSRVANAPDLAPAAAAVDKLLAGAAARGVAVEEFRDPWLELSWFQRYDKPSEDDKTPHAESGGS